jgi:hypothetical protein
MWNTQDAVRDLRLLNSGAAKVREALLRTEVAARTEIRDLDNWRNESVTRKLGLLVSAFALAGSIIAGGASADVAPSLLGGNCGTTSQPFAQWNDSAAYYLAGNGGFESAGGWTLSGGSAVVAGNESFYVHGKQDHSALLLPTGSTATSAQLCFGLLNPGIRFFAMSPTGAGTVKVQVIAYGLLGALTTLDGGTVNAGKTWAPSPKLSTTLSQLNSLVGAKSIAIKLTAVNGSVEVDDVYIDPFLAR